MMDLPLYEKEKENKVAGHAALLRSIDFMWLLNLIQAFFVCYALAGIALYASVVYWVRPGYKQWRGHEPLEDTWEFLTAFAPAYDATWSLRVSASLVLLFPCELLIRRLGRLCCGSRLLVALLIVGLSASSTWTFFYYHHMGRTEYVGSMDQWDWEKMDGVF